MKIQTFSLCLFFFWSQKLFDQAPDKVAELITLLENQSYETDQ